MPRRRTREGRREEAETPTVPVVVGFDGSRHAVTALRWALDAAATHAAAIRLVYVVEPGPYAVPTAGQRPGRGEHSRAEFMLAEATDDAEEAAARGVALVAVHAWTPPPPPWAVDVRPVAADVADQEGAAQQVLTAALHGWHEKYPAVPMAARLMPYDARRALVVASRDARLVVVGCHSTSGPHGVRLVSQYLLHHAACPVAVVHDRGVRPGTAAASAS